MPRVVLLATCSFLAVALPAQMPQGPIGLEELAQLARARSERQRPAQLQALEPFLPDLALRYRDNQELLDKRIAQVVELGDAIVPLLLEKLTPAEASPEQRNLAENCYRVLARLDPAGFSDALVELVGASDELTRRLSIRLLGETGERAATHAIARVLPQLSDSDLLEAVDSLTRLGHPDAAPAAAARMAGGSSKAREAVLGYLTQTGSPAGVDAALTTLGQEPGSSLALAYARYFVRVAPGNAAAAELLARYLSNPGLDTEQKTELATHLAKIAPPEHATTLDEMRRVVADGELGPLPTACAVAMRDLGDKLKGIRQLFERLDDLVNKRKRDPLSWELRADAYLAVGKLPEATRDYDEALQQARGSESLRSALQLKIARCEGRRGRWAQFKRAVTDGGLTLTQLQREAKRDPEFAQALEEKSIRRFLDGLPR